MKKTYNFISISTFVALCFFSFSLSARQVSSLPEPVGTGNIDTPAITPASYQVAYLNSPISLKVTNVPLAEVLNMISSRAGVRFSYSREDVPINKRVTVSLDHVTLVEALNQVFASTDLIWTALEGRYIVITQRVHGNQATGEIRGKVVDAQAGDPLPGANVLLKGTSIGASTDLSGKYSITDIPPGSYTIRVSYIGYKTRNVAVELISGEKLDLDLKLRPVGVSGKEVVVTAQASGQNAAINEQLSSKNIVSVVSAARIRQLPDANAAESVGRLPGVYLLRSGGEGYAVSIRGLQPKYNEVMIDGVQIPSNSTSDRSVNMSMISSDVLSGIEVYKTVTPDMDAAVLGGVVNFQLRKAHRTATGAPEINLSAQGGYDNLQNAYNDYKLSADVGDRFFNDRFGVLAQIIVENLNLTSDNLGAGYGLLTFNYGQPNQTQLNNLSLTYYPRSKRRYDGTITMDYKLPHGEIDLMNFFSASDMSTQTRSQSYDLNNSDITYTAGSSYNPLNVIMNLLDFKQRILNFDMDFRLSHSYTENITPDNWSATFNQSSAGISSIPRGENPQLIYKAASAKTNLQQMFLSNISTSNDFFSNRDLTASLDLKREFTISNLVSGTLKFGGMFRYTHVSYGYNTGSGSMYYLTDQTARQAVLNAYPWMTQSPYNLTSGLPFPIAIFSDPSFNYGTFLSGAYTMGLPANLGLISRVINTVIDSTRGQPAVDTGPYTPNVYSSGASNYSGNEYRSAGYVMATVKIGPEVTLIPGVRYQALETSYSASQYFDAGAHNPYPSPLPHLDTTMNQYHGYWLPDIILMYRPFSWGALRLGYTNTLSYPDRTQLTPRIDVNSTTKSVTWNNVALKPARSQNYDLALSLYDNSIGLISIDGFLKQIDNLIFNSGGVFITNPAEYSGLPSYTRGYFLSSAINNPYRVNLWGTEVGWETHFWYLPGPLNGLVFNINYTHIFSGATYPYVVTHPGSYPTYITTYVDTSYSSRLIDQPDNIVNLSLGYDYQRFSAVVSMIYQANVFSGTNFWPELRSNKAKYLRWDMTLRQGLPWPGLSVYCNLIDLNSEPDIYVIQANNFPTSEEAYGMTAELGIRWSFQ